MNNVTITSKFTTKIHRSQTQRLHTTTQQMGQRHDGNNQLEGSLVSNKRHKIQVPKLVHNLVPTNSLASKYKDSERSVLCPLCHLVPETRDHLIRCPHSTRRAWYSDTLVAVRKYCQAVETGEDITSAIVEGLSQWFQDTLDPDLSTPEKFDGAIQQQSDIGW